MKFVSLHHHTTFSFMDGHGTPAQHIERAAELEMPAIAFTEHGNTSSHPQAEKAAKKAGVKFIPGLEAYTALEPGSDRKFHQTLLASDAGGYRTLNRIVSRSWAEGFHRWPTVLPHMIREDNAGLIVLSGCADSELACKLLGGKSIPVEEASWDRAVRTALDYREVLGDRYYLECQIFPELDRAHKLNQAWEELSRKTGIPLVATADVHTVVPGKHEVRALIHAAGRGGNTIAQQMSGWEYEVPDYVPLSDKKVLKRLMATGMSKAAAQEACRNTGLIASRCNVELPKAPMFKFPLPPGYATARELLMDKLREGWRYRLAQGDRTLVERQADCLAQMHRELKLIGDKGFDDYFLLVADPIVWAKERGISVGPGRGSSAASIVCYLLRITEPNPLDFPLTDFSRFIDPTREDLPDIDIDFQDDRRHEVRAYFVEKYGEDHVGNIGTFTKYKGKNALEDVRRVYRLPKGDIEALKGMIVERSGGDSRADAALMDTIEMFPNAKAIFDKHPAISMAVELEGNYRSMSTHSAGLVVTTVPVSDICAQYTREVKGRQITAVSVDKYDAEYLGLMKIDLLGLSTMGMISIALEFAGLSLEDLYRLPLDDPATIEAFHRNDVIGVFQFEGRATRLVGRDLKPENFLELVDVNALSRPGPLFSGTTAEYIDVKHGRREPTRIHPIIDRIAAGTKGQIIYQEQILHALSEFGGLPVKRVHEIRRIISKKLGEAQFNTSARDFATNAAKMHGVSEELAMEVWSRVVTSASYAFVYSHSLAYTIIGYWCMWLKVHHPEAFYAAQLRKVKEEKWPRLIRDAEAHGVKVRPATPGLSGTEWKPNGTGEIVAGWRQLKGIGEVVAARIEEYDREHPIQEAKDLLKVKGIGPKTLEKFRSQMESDDPFGLLATQIALDAVRRSIEAREIPLRSPTVVSDDILDIPAERTVVWLGMVKLKEYKDIFEDERARTGESLEDIRARIKRPDLPTSCVLHAYDDAGEDVYVRISRYQYPKFKEALQLLQEHEDVIWVRAKKSKGGFGASIYADEIVIIDPADDDEDDAEE